MTFVAAEPFPPGEYIKDEMEARGWTHDDLAEIIGISRRQVINLIQNKSGITVEMAHHLGDAFTQNAETWINLQASYESALLAQKERETQRRAKLYSKVPIREIKRRGWIEDVSDTDGLETAVCDFLKIPSIDEQPAFSVATRKGTDYGLDSGAHVAWYRRAHQLANCVTASKYREQGFERLIEDLRPLTSNAEDVRRVPRVLADHGIRFVIVEHLSRTKLDGVAFWLNRQTPVVALSLRHNRIDNFWFTLMHELVHIKHRHQSPVDVDLMSQGNDDLPEFERQANREAADYLIPKAKLQSFIARKGPRYSNKAVIQFANVRGVHPGLVTGQLHHRNELAQTHMRRFLVKVRGDIIGSALTDGWGCTVEL